jgi:trehalose 6-phosphate synthase
VAGADVVIASNRGPGGFRRDDNGDLVVSRGAGGLVSAMRGLAGDGALWVCSALGEVDREVARGAPGGRLDRAGYAELGAVVMLPIDAATFEGAYTSIANTTLWFLHHEMVDRDRPITDDAEFRRDWASYVDYNASFRDAIVAAASPSARILVQDYHLALLPAMLRERRPDLHIGHFTHTPWASPSVLGLLPADIAAAILTGMLGADSVGFHSRRWAREFIDCCVSLVGAADLDTAVRYDGRTTGVRVHPLGVDATPLLERAAEPDVAERRADLADLLHGRRAIVRVDRTEPSKNIVRGIAAVRELLLRHPEHREQVVHVALAYPSRQDVAAYRRYTDEVRALAAEVNAELGTPGWSPINLSILDDYALSLATLQIGDVQLINPVRDGMNLVAKEAALLTDDAVLVLSDQAGAADEMRGWALLVDPFDVGATAEALHRALVMPVAERRERHAGLVAAATALPPQAWLRQQLDALA